MNKEFIKNDKICAAGCPRVDRPLLQINDLKVNYFSDAKKANAVDGVRLKIEEGSIFALLGESGCGKTTLGLSITNLINPKDGKITYGSVVFEDENILRLPLNKLRDIRGKKISYIFQEPASSLNPVFTIGQQIDEVLLIHKAAGKKDVKEKAIFALEEAGLQDATRVYDSYPHQISGGMKQRAMIAMAIAPRPKLLIADEPTTALDADTEAKILDLLLKLRRELSLSILFITHNIRIVEKIANDAAVMQNGKIVEVGKAKDILANPKHAYTRMLLDCLLENLKL